MFFDRKRSDSFAAHEKKVAGARGRNRGRGFKWRGAGPFKPQTALLRRRPSVGTGCRSGVSQTSYTSGFRRTWVCLGERGRRDRFGARRGESLFSPILRLFQRGGSILELFKASGRCGQASGLASRGGGGYRTSQPWRG